MLGRFVKWRDQSHLISEEPERWVPEMIISLYEGNKITEKPFYLSQTDVDRIQSGELVFSTREQVRSAAYEMAKRGLSS